MYALALDLGTTTLAASLIELPGGRRLAQTGSMNPQRCFGADVVSRLDAAVHSETALTEMSQLIRSEIWRLATDLSSSTGIPLTQIQQIAIAGNPAMQHLLLGLPVRTLAFPPYRPLFTGGRHLKAIELGWESVADVYLFPMPGGFVGGDTVAFLYGQLATSGPAQDRPCISTLDPALYLDMGTNGEIALVTGDTIWATSAAAGPAFEGGNLSCGMAALPGAVSSVRIDGDRVRLATIGTTEPIGICGSAAIETVSELLQHDLLEPTGRLRDAGEIPSNLAQRLVLHQEETAFVIHRDARRLLLLTQSDIRQIQLAKGAIRAGIEVVLDRSRIRFQALKNVILTGSFGAVLRPEWLKSVGIFDTGMLQDILFIPEGALTGVERALARGDRFESVEQLGHCFKVVPLSGTPLFEQKFMQHINFPAINNQ